MLTRPLIRPVVGPLVRRVTDPGYGWSPHALFSSGEAGAWYDPSDFSTLFQDAAGTTPVTALGQPVGKVMDKSGRGNHGLQSTSAARPTVEARVNLLLATTTLSTQSVTVAAIAHTLSFYGTGTVTLSGVSTAGPLVGTGANDRVSLSFTPTAGSLTLTVSGSVTTAQLEFGSAATTYQRVTTATDYADIGLPKRFRTDWVDDWLANTLALTDGEMWTNTPWGHYKSELRGTAAVRLPLNDPTKIIMREGTLSAAQIAALAGYFGTDRKYMIGLSSDTTIAGLRIYSGGAGTDLLFVGANGATVTKTLSANSDSSFDVSADGLAAPVAVVWPWALAANTALTHFYCYSNNLTGSIPSLAANTALVRFYCLGNQLTGSIPSLTANTALQYLFCNGNQLTGALPSLAANAALLELDCNANQLTGSIPSLAANTALASFLCNTNQLTGYAGGGVSATLGTFRVDSNLLTAAAVNAILADFVAAGRTTGTRVLNLGGTGNAAPTGQGITDAATLVTRGWTVTTN